jgi:hypothetical protein
MKKIIPFFLLLFFSYSCQHEENLSPSTGKVTFSLFQKTRVNGRVSEAAVPAFVLLSISDSDGNVQENTKLSLYAFGQGYVSENLQLQIGNYWLTRFVIVDATNKIIYATPLEGSDLAKYVTDPLPLEFTVTNEGSQVTPEVLAVLEDDEPELFGYVSFGFDVVKVAAILTSEEYLIYDPANSASTDGFVGLYKMIYTYDRNKLVQIDEYDYDPRTNSYDQGFKYQEYHYDSKGKLSRKIQFVGTSGLNWMEEFEYLNNESIKVTRQESYNNVPISQPDWWIIEKGASSLTVKYYQLKDELYAELYHEMDEKGNVISVTREPSFPGGKIYYKYDNSPNPYKFPELGGAYGGLVYDVDTEKYISQNNVVEVTNDSNTKSTRMIKYNKEGYPVIITAPTFKRVLTYH